MQELPSKAQCILSSIQSLTSQKAAEIADIIQKLLLILVRSTDLSSANSSSNSSYSERLKLVEILIKEEVHCRRSLNYSRNTPVKHVLLNFSPNYKICWYHHTFKLKADKCT